MFPDIVRQINKRADRVNFILKIFFAYITITGLITFSLFILEESSQILVFANFAAKSANQWDLVLENTDLIQKINTIGKVLNYSLSWIQPLALLSYGAYFKATDHYIKTMETIVFAHAPELFVGREVNFSFYPKRIETLKDGKYLLTNGRIAMIFDQMPILQQQMLSGILYQQDKYLIVR